MKKLSTSLHSPSVALVLLCMMLGASTTFAQTVRSPRSSKEAIENEAAVEAARQQFFYDRLTSGTIKDAGEIERKSFEAYQAIQHPISFRSAVATDWTPISPNSGPYVCGRLRSIVFDPAQPKIAYAAAAQGGIWKTTDITASTVHWTYLSDKFPTLVFGALAIDPKNGSVIYAGTGETHPGYVKTDGFGIYKSTDAGLNWQQIADQSIVGPSVAAITVDPLNSNNIVVATGSPAGLLFSTNAGATWGADQVTIDPFSPLSVSIDPKNDRNVITSSAQGGIYFTNDGGGTWTRALTGLPQDSVGTTSIAMAMSSPATVYASIGNLTTNTLLGVWRTDDFGSTWNQVNDGRDFSQADTNVLGDQAFYANTIAVNPTNPDEFVIGGLNTYFSTDGGASFTNGSAWEADPTDPRYSHADVHYATYQGNTVYLCTDGGLSRTSNRGQAWSTSLSSGIDAFQFIGIDAPKSFNYVIGGLQDNGVQRTSSLAGSWAQTRGGDGGITHIPVNAPGTVFSTFYGPSLTHSNDNGVSWIKGPNNDIDLVTNKTLLDEGTLFYAPMDVSQDGNEVAMGGKKKVYVSFNGGLDGMIQEANTEIGTSTYIFIDPKNPTQIWAGTNDGTIHLSTNSGQDWFTNTLGTTGSVIGITKDQTNNIVYAIQGGLANNQSSSFALSTDGGANWINPAVSGIPQIPFNSIAVATNGTLFIGTDYNVITSTDHGVNWQPVGTQLPPVQVLSLAVRGDSDQYLLAGTHGRGAWYFPLKKAADPLSGVTGPGGPTFQLLPVIFSDVYPSDQPENPTIRFVLEKGRDYTLKLYDAAGREIRNIDAGFKDAGTYGVKFDEGGLAAGEYFVGLASYGQVLMQRLVVLTPH